MLRAEGGVPPGGSLWMLGWPGGAASVAGGVIAPAQADKVRRIAETAVRWSPVDDVMDFLAKGRGAGGFAAHPVPVLDEDPGVEANVVLGAADIDRQVAGRPHRPNLAVAQERRQEGARDGPTLVHPCALGVEMDGGAVEIATRFRCQCPERPRTLLDEDIEPCGTDVAAAEQRVLGLSRRIQDDRSINAVGVAAKMHGAVVVPAGCEPVRRFRVGLSRVGTGRWRDELCAERDPGDLVDAPRACSKRMNVSGS